MKVKQLKERAFTYKDNDGVERLVKELDDEDKADLGL